LPRPASSQDLVLESASTPTSSGGAPTYVTNNDGSITTSPEIGDLTDGTMTMGSCVGGSTHLNLIPSTSNTWGGNALQWGACADSFALGIAINEALSDAGTGISLDKIHYSWKYINGCFNVTKSDGTEVYCDADISSRLDENMKATGEYADQLDTLNIVVTLTDAAGNVVKTKTYDYDTWYSWYEENAHSSNEEVEGGSVWQVEQDYMEIFNHLTGSGTIYTPAQLGDITFVTTAQDNGQWNGYYGPVVKDGSMWFTYRNNPCDLDTLYNPTCPGYAEAYVAYLYNKACEADTLYDSGCPGYDTAYLNQQCNIDQLYSPSCPLYQVAYYNQQCELDSQYDLGCPNYIAPSTESNVAVTAPESIEEILAETNITSQPIAELNVTVVPDIPIIQPVIVEEIPVVSDISTESIEQEIAQIELQVEDSSNGRTETEIIESNTSDSSEGDGGGDSGKGESGSEPEQESQEKPAKPEKNDGSGSDTDGKSKESSDDESSESESDDGEEKDTGEDTSSEDDNGKDKEVDEGKDTDETIESEEDATGPEKKEEKPEPSEKEKKDSRTEKIKALVAAKIEGLRKKIDNADTIEEQMIIQAQLLALIAFVPDFDYGEMEVPDIYFYPPKPTVDHEFSRWFVNDPTFGAMEDLQYPNLR
jgi:hypothetical protein